MAAQTQRLSKERLEAWLDRTDTKLFRQYLRDQQLALMQRWAAGEVLGERYQAKALLLGEFADLAFDDYARFYAEYDGSVELPPDTESAAQ